MLAEATDARYRRETPVGFDGGMGSEPITVSIRREVDPGRIAEATVWVQTGVNLANRYPGFLGSGWVRAGEHSDVWHMLYRFADEASLEAWERSPERTWWLEGGAKEPAIRAAFDVSAGRYYQLLSRLIDSPAAYAYDPLVVLRLRRQRDRRRRARFSGSPAEGGPQR